MINIPEATSGFGATTVYAHTSLWNVIRHAHYFHFSHVAMTTTDCTTDPFVYAL